MIEDVNSHRYILGYKLEYISIVSSIVDEVMVMKELNSGATMLQVFYIIVKLLGLL